MNKTKLTALLLVIVMCFSVLVSCQPKQPDTPDNGNTAVKEDFTYYSWSTSLGTNWNPHTWEMSGDSAIMGYIETPLATMEALDTVNGLYQWVFEAATDIKDVTADHQDDLTKYGADLGGANPSDITESYVYEIKLNPAMKWENGVQINADTYIYSMQQLLNPKMRNYRANNYISGSSAIAGAYSYYNSEAPIYEPTINYDAGGNRIPVELPEGTPVYLSLTAENMTMASYSFTFMLDYYVKSDLYDALKEQANPYGMIELTSENYDDIVTICDQYLRAFSADIWTYDFVESEEGAYVWSEEEQGYVPVEEGQVGTHNYEKVLDEEGNPVVNVEYFEEFFFYQNGYGDEVDFNAVGLYKVDDYTIRYVCNTAYEYNYFLTSCTSNWIVYEELYEKHKKPNGPLTVTTYGTSKETSMSYGVYKIANFESEKQIVFVQNENWYGWEKDEAGNLVSYTPFLVDGETKQQYQTTKIVIDVMEPSTAHQKFLKGELTDYSPTAMELLDYSTSDRLYKVDETYTMRFFFNTNVTKLQDLDQGANKNSVVISNDNFRKAMSYAIDRTEYVTATEGWKPAYSLINSLYHYDIYNDPSSSFRASDEAMQAIVNLYGVKYGAGEVYATLEEAYKSITGYNLTLAKSLMKTACEELVAEGLYTAGEDIKIQIGWTKGSLTDSDKAQLALLNKMMNVALEGSGFGTIEFEAIDGITNRYKDTAAGLYAIGYGAWGGAALYPFGMFQVYCDPDYTDIHEAGCWNPATEELTLTFVDDDGTEITDTLTWQKWSQSMEGTGKYASYSNQVKLQILAQLEEKYLNFYYCIPIAGTTICTLLSFQVDEYTENYNLMYGFGGFRLMTWNFNDAEWAEYVASQPNGTLNYK